MYRFMMKILKMQGRSCSLQQDSGHTYTLSMKGSWRRLGKQRSALQITKEICAAKCPEALGMPQENHQAAEIQITKKMLLFL